MAYDEITEYRKYNSERKHQFEQMEISFPFPFDNTNKGQVGLEREFPTDSVCARSLTFDYI